jgi:hypothetical protein
LTTGSTRRDVMAAWPTSFQDQRATPAARIVIATRIARGTRLRLRTTAVAGTTTVGVQDDSPASW